MSTEALTIVLDKACKGEECPLGDNQCPFDVPCRMVTEQHWLQSINAENLRLHETIATLQSELTALYNK